MLSDSDVQFPGCLSYIDGAVVTLYFVDTVPSPVCREAILYLHQCRAQSVPPLESYSYFDIISIVPVDLFSLFYGREMARFRVLRLFKGWNTVRAPTPRQEDDLGPQKRDRKAACLAGNANALPFLRSNPPQVPPTTWRARPLTVDQPGMRDSMSVTGTLPTLIQRITEVGTFWETFDRLDQRLNAGYAVRLARTITYMIFIIHLEACGYYAFNRIQGMNASTWSIPMGKISPYVYSFYICMKTATSIGALPAATNPYEFMFMTCYWLSGIFVSAILIGQTATSIGALPAATNPYEFMFMTCYWLSGIFVSAILIGQVSPLWQSAVFRWALLYLLFRRPVVSAADPLQCPVSERKDSQKGTQQLYSEQAGAKVIDILDSANANKVNYRRIMDATLSTMYHLHAPAQVTEKVRTWFMYNWDQQKTFGKSARQDELLCGVKIDAFIHKIQRSKSDSANANKVNYRRIMDATLSTMYHLHAPAQVTEKVRTWFMYNWDQQKTFGKSARQDKLLCGVKIDAFIHKIQRSNVNRFTGLPLTGTVQCQRPHTKQTTDNSVVWVAVVHSDDSLGILVCRTITRNSLEDICSTFSVPDCHATRRRHEGWDTARLPKPRQGKSRGRGWVRNTDLPASKLALQPLEPSRLYPYYWEFKSSPSDLPTYAPM
ncbi:hypothetical protein T265_05536 [Opisthorchis viverrini]|uniref:Uncharacterized protein n=1 Tax=Opisthorchis viverrini TaxID=6198 RepID=A0A074ZNR3_OPIVI|nr:hypothetical protein T265_05536 [Opisthorchis viverrini]KER27432.1 hypothetical protein T265_05536 [Opisthorchis viverrini]